MASVKFLHLADVHLDTPFYGREKALRRRLRDACRQAFSAGIDVAIERKAHAVLIAGDLFDNDILSFASERFLVESMSRLREAGIAVFYATGNHDPGRANYHARQIAWPDNVHLFPSIAPETVPIDDADGEQIGWLTAAGHSTSAQGDNLASRFEAPRPELAHVALLHTQITTASGATEHERYAPCSTEDLAQKGFDYWALGHIHTRQQVREDLPAWYPGNLQGRNPRETGPKGGLWVSVSKGQPPEVEFVELAPLIWDHVNVPCPADIADFQSLVDALVRSIRERLPLDDSAEHFLRVDLTGQSIIARDLHDEDNICELTNAVRDALGLGWLEVRPRNIVPRIDLEAYRNNQTVLGVALDLIGDVQTNDELLREIGRSVLARTEDENDLEYLRDLLDGLDREAAARLVLEEPE
ncbi:MAG: DNA repair exonuclease [Planctomycetes bacterium]|nr:DNA repair exonuclease [Planctomycetota bacterium]